MKVGIVGGRSRIDKVKIIVAIGRFVMEGDEIVSGGARGVDSFAEEYARSRNLKISIYLPGSVPVLEDETVYSARNRKIAEESDVLLAFPSKDSRGTWNTIMHAVKKNKRIVIFEDGDKNAKKPESDWNGDA